MAYSAQADYARRTARAQAAGYSSLAAQRTAQAHARGFTSRQAETEAAKQPTIQEVVNHWRELGVVRSDGAERRLRRTLAGQSYKKLDVKRSATYGDIAYHAAIGDREWFYH
jgi:hypothetical protein